MTLKNRLFDIVGNGLKTIFTPITAKRPTPADEASETDMSDAERRHAAALMRVNHCGEVCAQALYQGQALFSRDQKITNALQEAADEEIDHLAWTAQRIHELGGRQSFLNPLWYGGSFAIGAAAALVSDKVSLGFVAETEQQVSAHLQSHLQKLPANDEKSRRIVEQMDVDEQQHASNAISMGGVDLPPPVKGAMHLFGRLMTRSSYWM
ncbi:2-polyprenyl-3-methyl-6-methoxy-1,4-benzoquinone monooxygenase [Candidatus Persebacteraceae bacterium Df01]|jgi:ubiquinone biosynthesis monooxygenase Coq7|uniref:3-demethoxyubiquinol 3-hydroxylase n=1 Tax=Candidatus Doriopsillibacter californiensis TaxID=2970740 RepID=A0ABT7QPE7_9GAMM|nr:2-polyprenyl-3-methyl-6-methoxy-1,4-benzoquinone monooxygenase [Candidatus Persebacteraceae bacterium Df01]